MKEKNAFAAPSVAAVHDMSCVGRCALTVVIPALAAMGVQPVPLPTAVLSTHTGGYQNMAVRDLTGFIPECIEHWKTIDLKLDAVYSGYLAGVSQVDMVKSLIAWQKEANDALTVVDPVMGDEGKLYSAIPRDMPSYMKALCDEADLITPNLTEAALMLSLPYPEGSMTMNELMPMLTGFGAKVTIITSVTLTDGRHVNACHVRETGETFLCAYNRIPVHYPGTGDLFTSVLTGFMVRGEQPGEAMRRATAFLERTIEDTYKADGEVRAGVQLEKALVYLLEEERLHPLPEMETIQ